MRILICHNFYQQAGGEDQVFAAETELLRHNGHDVETCVLHNDAVELMGKFSLLRASFWNPNAAAQVRSYVRGHRAQVVHFHNTFPLFSPAAYWAARAEGAAVVQTLHNYRMLCPAATLFRDGKPCNKCVGHVPLASVVHKCYRGSLAATAVSAASLTVHRSIGSYAHAVDAYIALTQFAREKFLSAGFPADRVYLKPNFLESAPQPGTGDGRFALFVGRLTEEKGIESLLNAWKIVGDALPLKIIGDGPMMARVRQEPNVFAPGRLPFEQVLELMGHATMLIFPSIWYEGFPRTIVESFARGTPVAASELGSMKEIIDPGRTGILFNPNDPADMARKVLELASNGPLLSSMRIAAREEFETRYDARRNLEILMDIYRSALASRQASGQPQVSHAHPKTGGLAPS